MQFFLFVFYEVRHKVKQDTKNIQDCINIQIGLFKYLNPFHCSNSFVPTLYSNIYSSINLTRFSSSWLFFFYTHWWKVWQYVYHLTVSNGHYRMTDHPKIKRKDFVKELKGEKKCDACVKKSPCEYVCVNACLHVMVHLMCASKHAFGVITQQKQTTFKCNTISCLTNLLLFLINKSI